MFSLFKQKKTTIVTEMQADHLFDVANIHAASFSKAWNDGAIAQMLKEAGTNGLVANRGSKLAGFIIYRNVAKESEIITITTSPNTRRKGTARAIMQEYIRKCLTDRLEEIFLEVDEINHSAIKLYKSLGFKQVGMRKGYYSRGAINEANETSSGNALIMRLDLVG